MGRVLDLAAGGLGLNKGGQSEEEAGEHFCQAQAGNTLEKAFLVLPPPSRPPAETLAFHGEVSASMCHTEVSLSILNFLVPEDHIPSCLQLAASESCLCPPVLPSWHLPLHVSLGLQAASNQDRLTPSTLSIALSPSSTSQRLFCFVTPSSPCWGAWAELCVLLFHRWTAEHGDIAEHNCEKLKSVADWRILKKGDLSA